MTTTMDHYTCLALLDCADGVAACGAGNFAKAALLFAHSQLLGQVSAAQSDDARDEALKTLRAFEAAAVGAGNESPL